MPHHRTHILNFALAISPCRRGAVHTCCGWLWPRGSCCSFGKVENAQQQDYIWNGELFSLDGRKKVARRYSEGGRRCQEDAPRESKRVSGCNNRSPRGGGKEKASVVSLERVGARGDGRKQAVSLSHAVFN